jgi:hypothetical protein
MKFESFVFSAKIDGRKRSFGSIGWKDGEYSAGNYDLKVSLKQDLELELRRKDGKEMDLCDVSYEIELPLLNYGRVIVPDCGRFYMDYYLPRQVWGETFELTDRNFGNPFMALLDNYDKVELALGLLGELMETKVEFLSPGANRKNSLRVDRGMLRFRFTKPTRGLKMGKTKVFKDAIFQTTGDKTWFHSLRKYGKHYWDRRGGFDFNLVPEAFKPAFCTWVSYNSDDLNHDKIVEIARASSKLNMKSFILDDGWYGTGLDSERMESDMGDWPESNWKYPDIKETIKAIKSFGLLALIWYGPTLIGPHAKVFPKVKKLIVEFNGKPYRHRGNFHVFCPRNPEAREFMIKTAEKIMGYGADGMKIDLLDYVPGKECTAKHHHDVGTIYQGMTKLCSEMYERVMKINSHAWIGEKNNFGNVEFAKHATTLRGGDSPFDININFARVIYPAAYTPAVHNDYLVWTFAERPRDLATLLIKHIVGGVPNFAVDVLQLPEEQGQVLKAWLDFFNKNTDLYMKGVFEPQTSEMNAWQRSDGKKNMITLLHPGREVYIPSVAKTFILNASGNEDIYVKVDKAEEKKATAYDYKLEKVEEKAVKLRNGGIVKIPVAGMLVLE